MNDELTIGEQRVRTKFNPSQAGSVELIKQQTAKLIDLCESLKDLDPRLASLAQTAYEEAAMWAVKAATAQPKVQTLDGETNPPKPPKNP